VKRIVCVVLVTAVVLFAVAPIVYAEKDADKGKSVDKGKSDDKGGDKGKGAPSAPELPGLWMILGAAAIGGGYLLTRRCRTCQQKV